MLYVTIFVHELSHYLYGLLDEYNNNSVCLGDIATQACIMGGIPMEQLHTVDR